MKRFKSRVIAKAIASNRQLNHKRIHASSHVNYQRRSTADPLSLQRRKTRHAFTERDRTRKLAARIVEMGNILTAAGETPLYACKEIIQTSDDSTVVEINYHEFCSFVCSPCCISGRFCKQEKLPILTAAVKYVYALQGRLQSVAAKKPRLLQTLQKLKGIIWF